MVITHNIQDDKTIRKYGGTFAYKIIIAVKAPRIINVSIKDSVKPNTVYYYRKVYFDEPSQKTIFLGMPQSPKTAIISIYEEGTAAGQSSLVFDAVVKITPLRSKLFLFDYKNDLIKEFIPFAQWFAANCGIISTGVYMSENGTFRIDYLKAIRDEKGNINPNNSARVSINRGIIEVSQLLFKNITVFGRMILLLHEFSHYYLNKDIYDEEEADLNGVLIFIGLGYPKIEAMDTLIDTYARNDTSQNRKRYEKLYKTVKDL